MLRLPPHDMKSIQWPGSTSISPMLIVVGTIDRFIEPARKLHSLVEQAKLIEIEGAPRKVYYEAVEPHHAAVGSFLERFPD